MESTCQLEGQYCSACGLPPREKKKLKRCSRCQNAWYHDLKCQKRHFPQHKNECKTVSTKTNNTNSTQSSSQALISTANFCKVSVERRNGRGNCLVANSRIRQGERIRGQEKEFWEPILPPILHENCRSTHCAYCFGKLGEIFYRYEEIQPPRPEYLLLFCSTKCREFGRSKYYMALEELAITRIYNHKGPPKIFSTAVLLYRILVWTQLYSGGKSKDVKQQLNKLQHEIICIKSTTTTTTSTSDYHTQAVIQTVSAMVQVSKESGLVLPSLEEMTEMVNRIKLNGFSICDGESVAIGVALFDTPSFMNHSCRPNAMQTFLYGCNQLPCLFLTAFEEILPTHEVCISYIDNTCPRSIRQERLDNDYFFRCTCYACEDIKYDSRLSGILCHKCNNEKPAVVLVEVHSPSPATYHCQNCENNDFHEQVTALKEFEQSQLASLQIEKIKKSYTHLKGICTMESWYVQESADRLVQALLDLLGGNQESPQIQQQVGLEALKVLEELLECKLESTGSNFFRQTLRLYKAAKLRLFLMPDPGKSISELEMVKNSLSHYYPENHELMIGLKECLQNAML